MAGVPWDAISSFGGSVIGSGLNAIFGNSAAKKAFKNQKQLMALQQQYAVENWNRENNYNTPAAQKQRLIDAGLNPDLMYGQGAGSLQAGSIDAPTAPSAPMAPAAAPDFGDTITKGAQAALAIAQAKKSKQETIAQQISNDYLVKRNEAEIRSLLSSADLSDAQKREIEARIPTYAAAVSKIEAENDALKQRLGYEGYDRYLSAIDTHTKAALASVQMDDTVKTRAARIFRDMAAGRASDANAFLIDFFKNPGQYKQILSAWKDALKDAWNDLNGTGEKDSEGHSSVSPLNKSPNSTTAKVCRSIFMYLDDFISGQLDTPQPWKK